MTSRSKLPAFSLMLAVDAWLMVGLGVALARWDVIDPLPGMVISGLGGVGAMIPLLLGSVALRRGSGGIAWIAVAGAGVLVAGLIVTVLSWRGVPRINDITTDTHDPPVVRDRTGRPIPYPERNATAQAEAYGDVVTVEIPASPVDVAAAVEDLVHERAWVNAAGTTGDRERVITAVATTPVFRFQDDVTIRIRPGGANRSRVDLRSRSRVGRSDLGVNARRIREFTADLRRRFR